MGLGITGAGYAGRFGAFVKVLVVEDGEEYSRGLSRFLGEPFALERAGDGPSALERLQAQTFDVVFLDMRFDRAPRDRLLGDLDGVSARLGGDAERAARFLEDNQGAYILAALREGGFTLPVLMSYDFDGEPRRWKILAAHHAPVAYLNSNAGPDEVRAALEQLVRGDGAG